MRYEGNEWLSNLAYKPQLISNDREKGNKVLTVVENDLSVCEEFCISVAFITMGGLTPLLQTLQELEKRGIPGRILTTDYLNFSEPQAIRRLAGFKNITVKMYMTDKAQTGFHTKGYIFKKEEVYHIMVGSSNMTLSALTTNREWNTHVVSCQGEEYAQDVMTEFLEFWNSPYALNYEEFIDTYENAYIKNQVIRKQKRVSQENRIASLEQYKLQPNSMQTGFIVNLQKLRAAGEKRALLIDFYKNGEIDPIIILEQYKTYYFFLQNVEMNHYSEKLSEQEITTLEYLSRVVARGKRPHETELLAAVIEQGQVSKERLKRDIEEKYHWNITAEGIDSAIHNLCGQFVSKEDELKKYMQIDMLEEIHENQIKRMIHFYEQLKRPVFYTYVNDLVDISRARFTDLCAYKTREDEFVLYEKYSRRDVCQLLNATRDLSSTMYGMKRIDQDACIFVTYHKREDTTGKEYLDGKPDYADEFINNQIFMWDSQIGKGPESSYMREVLQAERRRLFIKKSDAEGSDFYYMGLFDVVEVRAGKKKDNHGRMREITKVKARMHREIREDLLDYLQNTI